MSNNEALETGLQVHSGKIIGRCRELVFNQSLGRDLVRVCPVWLLCKGENSAAKDSNANCNLCLCATEGSGFFLFSFQCTTVLES